MLKSSVLVFMIFIYIFQTFESESKPVLSIKDQLGKLSSEINDIVPFLDPFVSLSKNDEIIYPVSYLHLTYDLTVLEFFILVITHLHHSTALTDCVFSLPSYYSTEQISLLSLILEACDVKYKSFIPEYVCASLYYGYSYNHKYYNSQQEQLIVLIDMGYVGMNITSVKYKRVFI